MILMCGCATQKAPEKLDLSREAHLVLFSKNVQKQMASGRIAAPMTVFKVPAIHLDGTVGQLDYGSQVASNALVAVQNRGVILQFDAIGVRVEISGTDPASVFDYATIVLAKARDAEPGMTFKQLSDAVSPELGKVMFRGDLFFTDEPRLQAK